MARQFVITVIEGQCAHEAGQTGNGRCMPQRLIQSSITISNGEASGLTAFAHEYPLSGDRWDYTTLRAEGDDQRHDEAYESIVLQGFLPVKIALTHWQEFDERDHKSEHWHGEAQGDECLRHAHDQMSTWVQLSLKASSTNSALLREATLLISIALIGRYVTTSRNLLFHFLIKIIKLLNPFNINI